MERKLIWYSHVIHQVLDRAQDGDKAGQVTCRIRSFVDGEAVKEQSLFFADADLPENWNEGDLREACSKRLGTKVE